MSAGEFPAGTAPAGANPVISSVSARPKRPAAIRYEGSIRDWRITAATGAYEAVTPVEQGMVLSLCVRQGQIKSSPTTGHTLGEILYLGGQDLEADVRDRVMRSNPLARLVAERQAAVKRIDVQDVSGQLRVAVYFVDLTQDPTRLLRRDAALT